MSRWTDKFNGIQCEKWISPCVSLCKNGLIYAVGMLCGIGGGGYLGNYYYRKWRQTALTKEKQLIWMTMGGVGGVAFTAFRSPSIDDQKICFLYAGFGIGTLLTSFYVSGHLLKSNTEI